MKKLITLLLCLSLMLAPMVFASASVGRDILMVQRHYNVWTRADIIVTMEADGSRHQFDVSEVALEEIPEPADLLFFLRTHGLTEGSLLHGAPAPKALTPVDQALADQVRRLLGSLKEEAFERKFFAYDAGQFLTYAVIMREGEAQLTLISEGGTEVGESGDPAALELIRLIGPSFMGE